MYCCWDSDGDLCGGPAETYRNLPLCPVHKDELKARQVKDRGSVARQAAQHHDLDEFPGFCYLALLPDGSVKIGYSNTEGLLTNRMKVLGRRYGAPVIQLAVIKGGFVAEAVLHDRFASDRLPGDGERFKYSPEMAEYLSSVC